MIKTSCKECGRVIEAYNENQLAHLMRQHQMTHEKKKKVIKR